MDCIVMDDYQGVALELAEWEKLMNCTVTSINEHLEGEKLANALIEADVIVVMRERTPITRQLMDRLPKLKLIVTSGMRNASIDILAAEEKGITVCGTKSLKFPPMELAWALMLNLSRHVLHEANEFKNAGPWQTTVGRSVHGKTLGLIGLGHIGKLMVPVAKAFGMNVIAWSPNLTAQRCEEVGVDLAESKEALLQTADIVSLHMVLSDTTRNLIARDDLAIMKRDALLINTSRAALVNENDLIDALKDKQIAGAGLDVFEQEPVAPNDPLRSLNNVLATPHLGYVADTNYHHYFTEAVEDISAFLAGEPIRQLKPKGIAL